MFEENGNDEGVTEVKLFFSFIQHVKQQDLLLWKKSKINIMPETKVILYKEEDGAVPAVNWLKAISKKASTKCLSRIEQLKQFGHELRRPNADYVRDGIYELRISLQSIQYRILYFFAVS